MLIEPGPTNKSFHRFDTEPKLETLSVVGVILPAVVLPVTTRVVPTVKEVPIVPLNPTTIVLAVVKLPEVVLPVTIRLPEIVPPDLSNLAI